MSASPVADGLFGHDDDGPVLLGSRCATCAVHYFPTALGCRNPDCPATAVEAVRFGRRGRLYSWTVQRYRPPELFRMDPWEPYAIGLVELPEGLRVLAMLTGCEPDDLEIGMDLRLVLEPLGPGGDVLTFKYAPAAA